MGFYYGSGSPQPPDEDDEKFHFREALALIFAMFKVLAIPFGIIFGGIVVLFALFWLFTVNVLLGYAVMGTGLGLLIARAIWTSKHPLAKDK